MDSSEIHSPRLRKLREFLEPRRFDAFLVTDINNVFYLTGFTGSTAAAIVTPRDAYLLVDPRYSIQARSECAVAEVPEAFRDKSTIDAASELVNEIGPKLMGYEADQMTVSSFRRFQSGLSAKTRVRSTTGVIRRIRQTKDGHEVSLIRRAAGIADSTLEAILPRVKHGLSERDLALLIDTTMRKLGADKEGFDTIAVSGPNSACPHAHPTDRILATGDLVKMDFGPRFQRYHSDITRTICIGEPDAKQREVYDIVLEAQTRAIQAIAPGKSGKQIDSIARDIIASAGYADCFAHGLGHSLGIEVHEEPRFSQTCDAVLEPGMVMTVEPGIYIEGWGGIRIEDDVLITESGCEVLTHAPKSLSCASAY